MNQELLEKIVKHIFYNLNIIKSSFIDRQKTKSLLSREFLLPQKLIFEQEDANQKKEIAENNVYGCQFVVENKNLVILLGDCSQQIGSKEYCLLVQLQGAPAYGLYLEDQLSLLSICINSKNWSNCNTYLQATFLAAMEQLKLSNIRWEKCTDYKIQFKLMSSFIDYYSEYYENS